MEKLNQIIEQKDTDAQNSMELLIHLTGEVNEAIKEEHSLGMTKGELALNQLTREELEFDNPEDLAKDIIGIIENKSFQGWQNQPTVANEIVKEIIIKLYETNKNEKPTVEMSADEITKFSKEAMKYIERHF